MSGIISRLRARNASSDSFLRTNRTAILIGLAAAIIAAVYWQGITGVMLFFFKMDPAEGLNQKLAFLLVPYLPSLMLVAAAWYIASRLRGRSAGTVAACVALPLVLAATLSTMVLRPW